MNNKYTVKIIATAFLAFSVVIFSHCNNNGSKKTTLAMAQGNVDSCNCYSTSPLYNIVIRFNNMVPGDLASFSNQSKADCFAWQEFIALNWPSNPVDTFGKPFDTTFVTWETYMPLNVMFQPAGAPPPPWTGGDEHLQYTTSLKAMGIKTKRTDIKLLTFTSKFEESDTIPSFLPGQAAPQGEPNWLGAQNGTNLWYEIVLNYDYYKFIKGKGYFNAITQHDSVKAGHAINFPQGQYNGPVGAIELKAAWMEVTDINNPKWRRYKLSKAIVIDQITKQPRNVTLALVGLHILHKTQNQPTWVWATFEQIDNVPDANSQNHPYGYNFNSSNCAPQTVTLNIKSRLTGQDSIVTVGCNANTPPPYYLNHAKAVPLQCTRLNPIDQTNATIINDSMQNNIRRYFPASVFQYYELVDVIWSQQLQPDPTKPVVVPRNINTSSMVSGDDIVANSTMETYVQNTLTCFNCHVFGSIAPYPKDSVNNNIFGDFSFAIRHATYPKQTVKSRLR